MNKNERNSVRKYDSIADNYDSSFDGRFTAKFKAKTLDFCNVSDGDKVLDVGCGNGALIHAISQKARIQAYGVDISPNMIEVCRKRYKGVNFSVSNGENIPFKDNTFDTIIICCVLHHLNDPRKFFREAQRTLRPNGVLIVGEPLFPFGIRQFVDWVISPILQAGDNKLFSHKRLTQLFTDNGFMITKIYKKGVVQIIRGTKI